MWYRVTNIEWGEWPPEHPLYPGPQHLPDEIPVDTSHPDDISDILEREYGLPVLSCDYTLQTEPTDGMTAAKWAREDA